VVHLSALGWNSHFDACWKELGIAGWQAARVVEEQRECYRIVGEAGEMPAEVTGRFRHQAHDPSDFPSVGDWVAINVPANAATAMIHAVLPRRTKLSRKISGDRDRPEHSRTMEQVLVANVDAVYIVASLNRDLNARRFERYLTAVWESGAEPVLILNKMDLCPNPEEIASEVATVASGASIYLVSAMTGAGLDELSRHIRSKSTIVLVGSSGVGKSTIINRLLQFEAQPTQQIRSDDDRGRHTTSYRRLFILPSGGILIDTPGLRELQLWDSTSGLHETFDDIYELAEGCRFRDCQHDAEPGCAVRDAIDGERLENYQKLKRELHHLDRRRDAAMQSAEKKIWKRTQKALRAFYKDKNVG